MKSNDETDADYMVRVLENRYKAATRDVEDAKLKAMAAFEAYNAAEKAARYLNDLNKQIAADARHP